MIKKINHVAIVVPALEEGMKFWGDVLGLPVANTAHLPEQNVDIAFLPAGESSIELVQPIGDESGVAKFLEKRGPGFHHICFEVDDIEASLAQLTAAGIPLIDETPRLNAAGKKLAFLHPKGTGGVLIELYQLPAKEEDI